MALRSSLSVHVSQFALIRNGEATGDSSDAGPSHAVLVHVLDCAAQLLGVLGVEGSLQLEAMFTRLHLRLLRSATSLPLEKVEMVLEHLLHCFTLPNLAMALFATFDCHERRADIFSDLATALCQLATPTAAAGGVRSAHRQALDALLALLHTISGRGGPAPAEGGDADGASADAFSAAGAAARLLDARTRKVNPPSHAPIAKTRLTY